jgi:hypothetical protein
MRHSNDVSGHEEASGNEQKDPMSRGDFWYSHLCQIEVQNIVAADRSITPAYSESIH